MGTRILEGVRINECDKPGAVFYDSTEGRAFGPVFDDAEEAESFLSFITGVDPRMLSWSTRGVSNGDTLYKMWLASGRVSRRLAPRLHEDVLTNNGNPHTKCLDCDALIDLHRAGGTHCDCGENWDTSKNKCVDDDGVEEWELACDLTELCFPLFNGLKYGNNDVAAILKKEGVIGDAEVDPEHSCLYVHFRKGKKQAEQFLWRLNNWLGSNWHRAYPNSDDPPKPKKSKRK